MKEKNHLALVLVIAFASVFMSGCWWDSCGGGSSGGFTVTATDVLYVDCTRNPAACGSPITPVPAKFPHPGAQVSGTQICDVGFCNGGPFGNFTSSGSVYNFGVASIGQAPVYTDRNGQATIANGRINAIWQGNVVNWGSPACGQSSATAQFYVLNYNPVMPWDCVINGASAVGPGPDFALANSLPSSITISNPSFALTTASGMPGLRAYNEDGLSTELLSVGSGSCPDFTIEPGPDPQPQVTATSVSADGKTVTFPYPKRGDGSPLPVGFYGFNVWNQSSPGVFVDEGIGFFGIGANTTSYTTPYGVDAVNVKTTSCSYYQQHATCSTQTTPYPLLTLSSVGEVLARGSIVGVGSQPVAIKSYKTAEQYQMSGTTDRGHSTDTFQHSLAIDANFGSNTVSIVDLINKVVLHTIGVGTQPAAVLIIPPIKSL